MVWGGEAESTPRTASASPQQLQASKLLFPCLIDAGLTVCTESCSRKGGMGYLKTGMTPFSQPRHRVDAAYLLCKTSTTPLLDTIEASFSKP